LRTFLAVDLPDPLRSRLGKEIDRLSRLTTRGVVRWVPAKGIHLTLKFLGEVDPGRVGPLAEAIRSAASSHPAFRVSVGGVGCFPGPRRPRVVWVGVQEPTGALAALQREIEAALAPLGFPPEEREFNPHLTLGRVRREATSEDAAKVGAVISKEVASSLGEIPVVEVVLFRSDLRPTGPIYTRLATAALEG
jgi:2'-5' RNA ligase